MEVTHDSDENTNVEHVLMLSHVPLLTHSSFPSQEYEAGRQNDYARLVQESLELSRAVNSPIIPTTQEVYPGTSSRSFSPGRYDPAGSPGALDFAGFASRAQASVSRGASVQPPHAASGPIPSWTPRNALATDADGSANARVAVLGAQHATAVLEADAQAVSAAAAASIDATKGKPELHRAQHSFFPYP